MPTTILVVDDDCDIRNLLELYLRNEGYQVLHATNGGEALQIVKKQKLDLVLLDIMMPEMDGLETCVEIRKNHQMPIIMLTANANDLQVIRGLSMGADDYVTKPFQPLQVMARVKAQLRRYFQFTSPSSSKEKISLQHILIDVRKREVKVGDKLVSLTPREYDILLLLARHVINEATFSRLFDTFVTGDSSRSTGSNGLGLAIVKRIVELHGGNIVVTQGENKITFQVYLPIAKENDSKDQCK
jgi:two-component system, OmpR family, response regulator VanR